MTTTAQKTVPKWLLVVSALFALMELGAGLSLFFSPESIADRVDLDAKGVDFLICMWATRQFALGCIFAFATIKRSIPMLTLAYLFFLVMFAGDLIVGILQKDHPLVISALVMCSIAAVLLFSINRKNNRTV